MITMLGQIVEWISVKDRMPLEDVEVLGYSPHPISPIMIVMYLENLGLGWCNGEDQFLEITHWMPLPEPPKTE